MPLQGLGLAVFRFWRVTGCGHPHPSCRTSLATEVLPGPEQRDPGEDHSDEVLPGPEQRDPGEDHSDDGIGPG